MRNFRSGHDKVNLGDSCALDDSGIHYLPLQQYSHTVLEMHMFSDQMWCSDHFHK